MLEAVRLRLPPLDNGVDAGNALATLIRAANGSGRFLQIFEAPAFAVSLVCADRETPLDVTGSPPADADGVTLSELSRVLAGATLNHVGVNAPADSPLAMARADLDAMLQAHAHVRRYPDGADWLFVFPPDDADAPLFEIAFEPPGAGATLQVDLDTLLDAPALTAMLPFGETIPGLQGVARSVYVRTGWPLLRLRLDFRWPPATGETFAQWLRSQGPRL
jgi:hypothetical protein